MFRAQSSAQRFTQHSSQRFNVASVVVIGVAFFVAISVATFTTELSKIFKFSALISPFSLVAYQLNEKQTKVTCHRAGNFKNSIDQYTNCSSSKHEPVASGHLTYQLSHTCSVDLVTYLGWTWHKYGNRGRLETVIMEKSGNNLCLNNVLLFKYLWFY